MEDDASNPPPSGPKHGTFVASLATEMHGSYAIDTLLVCHACQCEAA